MYKILDKINSIEDLKNLDSKDLPDLCEDIRSFLINHISKTGGHLAPNLGVVELTVALHYIFDSPNDKIIFDVGHQCYVHKILTGRKADFDNLRKLDGMSGFPKSYESVHDIFSTGHSSTSIASAIGIAIANKLSGKPDYTIAVIGDGSMTGGLAFEALNNASMEGMNLIVVLNDNQMSISPSVGNLSAYLSKIRSNNFYNSSKMGIKKILNYIPIVGKLLIKFVEWIKNGLKHVLLPQSTLFEHFGFTYLGPIDGHNLDDLTKILERAKSVKKPVLVHVVTKKGKGYIPAEENPDIYHSVAPFDADVGVTKVDESLSYSKKFGDTLVNLANKNEKIVAITAAMPKGTGLDEFATKYPARFFDVGIAEEYAVTFAGGLAKEGYIPVFAVYSTFLQRAYDEIIHDVALQNLHVVFAIDRAGIVGADGETHQGLFDLSFLSSIPNMTILAPKDGKEFEKMLDYAISCNGPVAIRYPRGACELELAPSKEENILKAEVLEEGEDITILGFGKMVKRALEVANILKNENIKAEIINVRALKPLDKETILKSVRKTKKVITIEDGIITGGLASAVQNLLINETDIFSMFFAYPDDFIRHGKVEEIEKLYGMDAENIAKEVVAAIERHNKKIFLFS